MTPQPERPRIAHLHCLYCGGERRGDDSACRRCLAEAPSVPCRHCGAQVFAPRDLCICGEPCTAWAIAEPSHLACPRCHGILHRVDVPDTLVHLEQCVRCLGCFVRTEDFSALVEQEAPREVSRMAAFIEPPGTSVLPRQDLLAEAGCPHCGAVMERVRFAQRAAIVIDICAKHGVWLDAGELPLLFEHAKRAATGESTRDAADIADQQHWDHVLAETAAQSQRVEAHVQNAERLADRSARARNVVLGAAVGGPWLGLFMAMRKGTKR